MNNEYCMLCAVVCSRVGRGHSCATYSRYSVLLKSGKFSDVVRAFLRGRGRGRGKSAEAEAVIAGNEARPGLRHPPRGQGKADGDQGKAGVEWVNQRPRQGRWTVRPEKQKHTENKK